MKTQRAKPTDEEAKLIDDVLNDFRQELRPLVLKHLKRFPDDLRIYGLIVLGQIAFEGTDFSLSDLEG